MAIRDWFKRKEKKIFRQTAQIINGQIITSPDNKKAHITDGYVYNDIVYSVIKLIADKVKLAQWSQYKILDESSLKSYKSLMSRKDLSFEDRKLALKYRKKALEITDGDIKVAKLLECPNEFETFSEFVANGLIYKLATGDRIVWAQRLEAGANEGRPQYLWNLPSQHISIEASMGFPAMPLNYKMFLLNQNFPASDILHDKYFNPDYDLNGSQLYGLSPLKAALRVYQRNNSAKTAQKAAFDNQGVKGVLFTDTDPDKVNEGNIGVLQETASKLKQTLSSNEYSGSEAYNKFGISGYRMGWVNIGLSPVDLAILESEKMDLNRICAIYGVPPQLVGNTEQSTYNNLREAEKALTTRCAIPELNSFRDCFNKKMNEWGMDSKIFIDYDQTCFTELDENIKDKVDWVTKLWMLSPNRQLELLNLETVDNPLFDEVWLNPAERVPLSDFENNEVDNALNNDV